MPTMINAVAPKFSADNDTNRRSKRCCGMTNLMKSRRFQPSRRFAGCALAAFAATAMLTGCSPQTLTPNMAQRDAQYALAVLDRAPEQGYPAGAFGVRQIHAAIARRDPQASQLLRAGVIAYARAEHGLLIPAKAWPAAWGSGPRTTLQ